MAQLQTQFRQFHDNIKLGTYEENDTLRTARDEALKALRTGLSTLEVARGMNLPTVVDTFGQGSYAMRTGVLPLKDGDYDIDVAVVMAPAPGAMLDDPIGLKVLVRDALKAYSTTVRIRQPCVTIEREKYHVDLAIYRQGAFGELELARGKEYSSDANSGWESSDPKGLLKAMQSFYAEEQRAQQRRVVRYLKRWRDLQLPNERIPGIALTLAVMKWFSPVSTSRLWGQPPIEDDLAALLAVVERLQAAFEIKLGTNLWDRKYRLRLNLPVAPYTDVLAQRTERQMLAFYTSLELLKKALGQAQSLVDISDACVVLERLFGPAFPTPTREETSQATVRSPVIHSGNQG